MACDYVLLRFQYPRKALQDVSIVVHWNIKISMFMYNIYACTSVTCGEVLSEDFKHN